MKKTTIDFTNESGLRVISPVFECDLAPGIHAAQGGPGEHMFEILHRWIATTFPQLTVVRVQQVLLTTWVALLADGRVVVFRIVV
jgi:hypothetical protein